VQVTLRGKKYTVEDVTTVEELQERVSEKSGISPSTQGRVLFDGQRLSPTQSLSDVGVQEGSQLNLVPTKTKSKKTSASTSAATVAAAAATATSPAAASVDNDYKKLMEQAGIDTSKIDEMMQSMGGGAGGGTPNMQESMEQMSSMMNSPLFQDMMKDPERLEQSRQMILNNPMLKGMMAGMPGMEEMLNDPVVWREAMQAAAGLFENMDPNDMMQAMMGGGGAGGMGGMGGMPGMPDMAQLGNLFDGATDPSTSTLALDELSEDED
jgi:hypothetical protein